MNDRYIDELPDIYKVSYSRYMEGHFRVDDYSSHQPLLIHTVNTITGGDVLELGMGDNSTPLLHLLCGKLNRKLFSYETDMEWYNKYKHYESNDHKILPYDLNKFKNNDHRYAIAFIDLDTLDTRQRAIYALKDSVDYFIIHDVLEFKYGQFILYNNYDLSYFKNILHFIKVSRTSVLCSNKEIPEELKMIFY